MSRITIGTAAILGLLAAAPVQAADAAKKCAIIVGVSEYQHSKFQPLKYAENDAVELSQVLRSAGYETTLLSDSTGQKNAAFKPTRANILKQLDATLKGRTRHDMVLVFLAGHGLQLNKENDNFFCPIDADPGDQATLLNVGDLFRKVDASGAGVKLLLIDACRDAPALQRLGINEENLPKLATGTAALFSCKSGERAFELEKYKHGVFTHYLLKGLRGEAANRNGEVTWGLLVEYVSNEVASDVPRIVGDGAQQSPNVKSNLAGKSPVLVKVDAQTPPITEVVKPGLPTAKDLVGAWELGDKWVIHLNGNATAVIARGVSCWQGTYTYSEGNLALRVTDKDWSLKAIVTWAKPGDRSVLHLRFPESTFPGVYSLTVEDWKRGKQTAPLPPPTLKELAGKWGDEPGDRDQGIIYNFTDMTFSIELGKFHRGKFTYQGNEIHGEIKDVELIVNVALTWVDKEKKEVRYTVLSGTNRPGSKPGKTGKFESFGRVPGR